MGEENRGVALADAQRAAEISFRQAAQNETDDTGRHREIVTPHQEAQYADDKQQDQVEGRIVEAD